MKAFARVRGPDPVDRAHVPRLAVSMVMARTGIDVTTHTRAAVPGGKPACGMIFLDGDRTGPSARGRRGPASRAGARFCLSGRVSQRSLMWSRRARHASATSDWKRGSATISSGPTAAGHRDAAAGCFGDGGAQVARYAGEGILGTHPAALGGHADPGHGLAVNLTAATVQS